MRQRTTERKGLPSWFYHNVEKAVSPSSVCVCVCVCVCLSVHMFALCSRGTSQWVDGPQDRIWALKDSHVDRQRQTHWRSLSRDCKCCKTETRQFESSQFLILHNIETVMRQFLYRAGPDHTLCLRMLHLLQIKVLEAFGGKRFFSDQSKWNHLPEIRSSDLSSHVSLL